MQYTYRQNTCIRIERGVYVYIYVHRIKVETKEVVGEKEKEREKGTDGRPG